MFFSKIITDKYGHKQKEFYLTQGDTATFQSIPTTGGNPINTENISNCTLKISDINYSQIFSKDFELKNGMYVVTLESRDTITLPVTETSMNKLVVEIEYTFKDGTINTPNQCFLNILPQIKDNA